MRNAPLPSHLFAFTAELRTLVHDFGWTPTEAARAIARVNAQDAEARNEARARRVIAGWTSDTQQLT